MDQNLAWIKNGLVMMRSVTRSQNIRLEKFLIGLTYSNPEPNSIEDQDQEPVKMFNHSVFGLAYFFLYFISIFTSLFF